MSDNKERGVLWQRPHDRLTTMANDLGHQMQDHPLYQPGDKIIVLLDDGTYGGIGVIDYEDGRQALVDLYSHMRAMAKALGIRLEIMFPDKN